MYDYYFPEGAMNQMPPLKCVEPDMRMSDCTKQNNN